MHNNSGKNVKYMIVLILLWEQLLNLDHEKLGKVMESLKEYEPCTSYTCTQSSCNFILVIRTRCDLRFQLALRAGHEKDEETADTVGCCSLRVEHISKCIDELSVVFLWFIINFCVFQSQRFQTVFDVTNVPTSKQQHFFFKLDLACFEFVVFVSKQMICFKKLIASFLFRTARRVGRQGECCRVWFPW